MKPILATMLGRGSRCLSLVSRALLDSHGGTLTALSVQWEGRGPLKIDLNALLRLVQQQRGLESVSICETRVVPVPALAALLAHGRFRNVRELSVEHMLDYGCGGHVVQGLTDALLVPGALHA